MNLQIQCPSCSKRFPISEELIGKTVECGSCEHRFSVKEEEVIREVAKFYPGKKGGDDFFNRLGRTPSAVSKKASQVKPAGSASPQVDSIMPASAGQNIASGAGLILLISYSLLFFIGTTTDGSFQGMDLINRIILGSFISVIGAGMLIWGAKNWRSQAVMISLILVSVLGGLTVIRPVELIPEVSNAQFNRKPTRKPADQQVSKTIEELKLEVGYEAVERKLRGLEESHGSAAPDHLVAIFVRKLMPGQYLKLQTYFMDVFEIPPDQGINRYQRGSDKRDNLIVISGFPIDFEDAVRFCDPKLGRANTFPELRLIDLKLSATYNIETENVASNSELKPGDRAFFGTYYKNLTDLNPDMVKKAISKLASVPDDIELQYQEEVMVEFMRLVKTDLDKEAVRDLAKGFRRWGAGNRAATTVVERRISEALANGKQVNADFLEYLIENKVPGALGFVDQLWSAQPQFWNAQYIMLGPVAEPRLLQHLEGPSAPLKKQAASILARVGSARSLPILQKLQNDPDQEFQAEVERAIRAIQTRNQ